MYLIVVEINEFRSGKRYVESIEFVDRDRLLDSLEMRLYNECCCEGEGVDFNCMDCEKCNIGLNDIVEKVDDVGGSIILVEEEEMIYIWRVC